MPRYTVDADAGTVTDDVTGLLWQRAVPPEPCPSDGGLCNWRGWSDTEAYCAGLSLGGFSSGWRLPTMSALYSLIDTNDDAYIPSIDSTAFPGTPTDDFLATTPFDAPLNLTPH